MLRATSSSTGGRQAVAGRPVGSGLASLAGSTLGVHAAQSLQARPGQGRAPSWGSAKGGGFRVQSLLEPGDRQTGWESPTSRSQGVHAKGGTLRPCCAASRASVPRGRRRLA